jgi:hypothetical protein
VAVFFIFNSCSDDLLFEEKQVYEKKNLNIKLEKVNFSELNKNQKAMKMLEKASRNSKILTKNKNNRNLYGYVIDTSKVIYLESENQHSYTFKITNEEPNKTENLILSKQNDEDYKAFYAEYDLTNEEVIKINQGLPIEHKEPSSLYEIDENTSNNLPINLRSCITTETITENWCMDASGNWMINNGELGNGCHDNYTTSTYTLTVIDFSCGGLFSNGSSNSNSVPSGGIPGSSTGSGNTNNWYPDNINNYNYTPNDTSNLLITTPLHHSEAQSNLNLFWQSNSYSLGWFYNSQHPERIQILNAINSFLINANSNNPNNWSYESINFANELVDLALNELNQQDIHLLIASLIEIKNTFEINSIDIYYQTDSYRSQMSQSELAIFDNMLPNKQMWYLSSAYKALNKSNELFPNTVTDPFSLYNGRGDAFRHALWNTLSSLTVGVSLTNQLTTAHENRPYDYPNHYKEKYMDLYNNQQGRAIASYSNLNNAVNNVLISFNNGNLVYLTNLDPASIPPGRATNNSQEIPTHP